MGFSVLYRHLVVSRVSEVLAYTGTEMWCISVQNTQPYRKSPERERFIRHVIIKTDVLVKAVLNITYNVVTCVL